MSKASHRDFKDRLYEQFARVGKAMANPVRLEIVDLLAQGERSVEALAEELDRSVANTSQHLQVLKHARLVEVRREGLYGYYRLADESVFRMWRAMRDVGRRRLAEVDRLTDDFMHDRKRLDAVSAEELLNRLQDESVTVLDVRPEEEYRAGHIPGSLSVPIEVLEDRLQQLPSEGQIVAYCRGPYCLFSDEAVALLRERGFNAHRLEEGLPDWRASGLPVEQAA